MGVGHVIPDIPWAKWEPEQKWKKREEPNEKRKIAETTPEVAELAEKVE